MALFIRQDEERSELQKRLAAELQQKMRSTSNIETKQVDGVKDSSYMESLQKPAKQSLSIILLIMGFVSIIIWLTVVK